MTTYQIPLTNAPAQSVSVLLGTQRCILFTRELNGRQYISLSSNGKVICENVLIQPNIPLTQAAYNGFVGELMCVDTQGNDFPDYTQWGSRWVLLYSAG